MAFPLVAALGVVSAIGGIIGGKKQKKAADAARKAAEAQQEAERLAIERESLRNQQRTTLGGSGFTLSPGVLLGVGAAGLGLVLILVLARR